MASGYHSQKQWSRGYLFGSVYLGETHRELGLDSTWVCGVFNLEAIAEALWAYGSTKAGMGGDASERVRMKLSGNTSVWVVHCRSGGEKTAPEEGKGKAEERKVLQNHRRNFKERAVRRILEKQFFFLWLQCGIWTFPGQEPNPRHSSSNAISFNPVCQAGDRTWASAMTWAAAMRFFKKKKKKIFVL